VDYYTKLKNQVKNRVIILLSIVVIGNIAFWWLSVVYFRADIYIMLGLGVILNLIALYIIANNISDYVSEPIKLIQQAILHISPDQHGYNAPDLEKAKLGRELVTNLALQVYQISNVASASRKTSQSTQNSNMSKTVLDNMPMPVVVLDKQQNIVYTNPVTASYLGFNLKDIVGKNVYSVLDFSFNTEETLDNWLTDSRQHKITSAKSWQRVRLMLPDQKTRRQLDLVAYYNKNNTEGVETILTLFDRTKLYNKEDDGVGFIALAVHELRTPLTMLRGYIEVFEDELSDELSEELADYLQKMNVSAQQLSDFVGNILNVARVEENQLFLQLNKESWPSLLRESAKDMELRAKVHGKHISFNIDMNLPEVAADRVSVYEVINNLLDNAIKYSGNSEEIIVTTRLREDGLIETTVQDFGIGIPTSIIGSLFEKFYRNHRSRAQIGGTGLGLYLSKAIVRAHGGQIWVQSKEGQGSTFGFTLIPYDKLADELKNQHNKDITRTAHGWIKNHSFYRS